MMQSNHRVTNHDQNITFMPIPISIHHMQMSQQTAVSLSDTQLMAQILQGKHPGEPGFNSTSPHKKK